MNEIAGKRDGALSAEQAQAVEIAVREIVGPVMEQIGKILERNSQAMERIAAGQQMMSQRIGELEKEVRLRTPLSRSQEKHVADAIRRRAKELLGAKGLSDNRKAVNRLAAAIRKSVLARYGADSLREAPAYDYETAMAAAAGWNDMLAVREIARSAANDDQGPGIRD